jgi:hypothetical protein
VIKANLQARRKDTEFERNREKISAHRSQVPLDFDPSIKNVELFVPKKRGSV